MRITIIATGKLKNKYYAQATEEYAKRLQKYCRFDIIEVADEKTVRNSSSGEAEALLEKEAGRILAKIPADAFVFTLEIDGQMMDSPAFARKIENLALSGKSHLCFIIGGSAGLHRSVTDKADFHLSFSKMTFPHQLMRVVLAEQIYRAFCIISNTPYHK